MLTEVVGPGSLVAVLASVLLGLVGTVVRSHGKVRLSEIKGRTMTSLTELLTSEGRAGRVTHRDGAGSEWTVVVGPASRDPVKGGQR